MMKDLAYLIKQAIESKHHYAPVNTSFTEIVKHFQDMVYGYIYATTRDTALSADITQEVFIKAYEHIEELRNYNAFPGWIKKIAKRECIKVGKKKRPVSLPLDLIAESLDSITGYGTAGMSPQESYEKKESRTEIRGAIERLPEKQRVPVVLYYIDGYSQKEVADFLHIKVNTVKKRLQRAREGLRKEMMHMVQDDLHSIRPSKDDKLLAKINLYTTFDSAAKNGQITILEQMIADGIDVNEKDATQRTLLHWAVENNHTDAVKLLLHNGADMTIKDKRGYTALECAQKKKNREIIGLLKRYSRGKEGTE